MTPITRPVRGVLALATLAAAAACAPVAPPPGPITAGVGGGQCFFASTISGFKPAGPAALNVRSSTMGVYRVDTAGPCDLRGAEKVLLDSRRSGPSVCPGADVLVIASSPAGPRSCPGRSIRKLAEAEVASLPAAERP